MTDTNVDRYFNAGQCLWPVLDDIEVRKLAETPHLTHGIWTNDSPHAKTRPFYMCAGSRPDMRPRQIHHLRSTRRTSQYGQARES